MDLVGLTAILDLLQIALRRGCEIDDLPVLERAETPILELNVAQENDDDFLSAVLRVANLSETLWRRERLWRGKKDNGFTTRVRLAESFLPALAGAYIVRGRERRLHRAKSRSKAIA